MAHLIFLSHIHEEKNLAMIIQNAIEAEFSGFVKVFVSSDGTSISAGANFLKRIENGLTDCIGGIYLISPKSVKRNWINFELGAIWIRNVLNVKQNKAEIPTIPFCHSGITPSELPMPLTNLNSILANNSAHLETAFRSIQNAVGGSGGLKTDFDKLANDIINFERNYTIGKNLTLMFKTMNLNKSEIETVIAECKKLNKGEVLPLIFEFMNQKTISEIKKIIAINLSQYVNVILESTGTFFTTEGTKNGGKTIIKVNSDIIRKFERQLREGI